MPFIANTPESLVGRSDSKNPATTCRGITSSGRPCRRPLAAADVSQRSLGSRGTFGGRLRVDDPRDERLYCWQHKEQASMSARSSPGPRATATPILEERTSLDTLADRLGLLGVNSARSRRERTHSSKSSPRPTPPSSEWKRPSKTKPPKGPIFFCCFFQIPLEEAPPPPPRPKPRPIQASFPLSASPSSGAMYASSRKQHIAVQQGHLRPASSRASSASQGLRQSLPGHLQSSRRPSTASQTAQYLALIPPTASPQTASALMAELAKPVSQVDEPGYIYMFWLTPESEEATPPTEAARSLLAPPSRFSAGGGQRRASDVVASFAVAASGGANGRASQSRGNATRDGGGGGGRNGVHQKGTLLLKIGRANNVQRRLNEWKRQCGYNLSLIRYYPYIPSSSSSPGTPSAGSVPRKVPHSHKVERLIHIELTGLGLRIADGEKCNMCGREHREWFQVEATRKAVTEVDEAIRRWADWDEGRP